MNCVNCDGPLSRKNISGWCRECHITVRNHTPEYREMIANGLRRSYALNPEKKQAARERMKAVRGLPQAVEARRRSFRALRVWEIGNASQPKGSPSRVKAGARGSATKLAHIPPRLRAAYRRLTEKKFTAAEATRMITEQHELEMARWRREIGAPKGEKLQRIYELLPTDIIEAVAHLFGVEREDLTGHRRSVLLVDARIVVAAHYRGQKSSNWIGRVLNRDHSTVLNLWRRFETRAAENAMIGEALECLSGRLAA